MFNVAKFVSGRSCLVRSRVNLQLGARNFSVLTPFKLADIGEGIAEVELMKWFVKEGDTVKSFDRICEVQSDKATVEITSRYNGVISKIYHEEGSIVKVGDSLLDILDSSSGASQHDSKKESSGMPKKSMMEATKDNVLASETYVASHKILSTPAVRKIAKENNVDLSLVTASGPKGRITKEDVQLFLGKSSASIDGMNEAQTNSLGNARTFERERVPEDRKVPIRGVQRLMVKSMTAANSVPHLTLCDEISFDELKRLKKDLSAVLEKKGVKLSYMPFIIKATSLALSQFPMLNASVNGDATEMIYHGSHNIGVAMDTPKGLIVPVIKNVQALSVTEIATELAYLQKCASTGELKEYQLSGGTFSLSNIGSIGGTYAVPVVVVPQVMIGALGRLQTVPRFVNSGGKPAGVADIESGAATVSPTTIMNVSWSADHRVVDGATVARFSNAWKTYIENPCFMIADLR